MTPQIKHSRFKTKIQLLFQITTYCLCICMQKTTSIFICKNKRKKRNRWQNVSFGLQLNGVWNTTRGKSSYTLNETRLTNNISMCIRQHNPNSKKKLHQNMKYLNCDFHILVCVLTIQSFRVFYYSNTL